MNGPKGGGDKSCRIAVELFRGRVVLEERGSDLYVAIDRQHILLPKKSPAR